MPRTFVVTLGILLVASLVIVPKFVFSRSQHTKVENPQAETCDLIVAGSTRYCTALLGSVLTQFTE
jgi:hypothetical protein